MTSGADWLDLNTFPPAEYALRSTRRLLNTWNTGFAITTSQCSANLCWIKPWIQISDPTAVTIGADWLDLNTFPPAEYVVPRTRRLLNSFKTGFCRYGKSNVLAISAKSNHEYRHSDPTAVALRADWLTTWPQKHICTAVGSESAYSWCDAVTLPEHRLALMAKPFFQLLKSLLVLGRACSTGGKVFRSSQSALRTTAVGSESSWFDST